MTKIWLSKKDIADIQHVLEKFPKVERFLLEEIGDNGIGTCINMLFEMKVNDVPCKISVPITDESTW